MLVCHYDPREKPGTQALYGYRVLCEQTGAQCLLEVVVERVDGFAEELRNVAQAVRESGLKPASVAVVPAGDLKSVLPGGERPPAPPLDALYAAARAAFPGVAIGGGMFSFFTELNRKRPPAELLDFVTNTTCPIVHAADDRSVMETHESLPYQIATARAFLGKTPHRVGPSAIGCRDNPHGKTFLPNPDNQRICLVRMDPTPARPVRCSLDAGLPGDAGTHRRTGAEHRRRHRTAGHHLSQERLFAAVLRRPRRARRLSVFHVIAGLTRAAGAKLVSVTCSDDSALRALAYKAKGATLLWIANVTPQPRSIELAHAGGATVAAMLDENSFAQATQDPRAFQQSWQEVKGNRLELKAYAVAIVCIND